MKSRYPVVRATLQVKHSPDICNCLYFNLQRTLRIPPDVGFGHDVLQPIAELKERLDLQQTRRTLGNVSMRASRDCGAAAAYPDDAVESVDGGELKVQTEKVEWEDAENISLAKQTFRAETETFPIICT